MLMHKAVHSETEAQLELSNANRMVEEARQFALEQEFRAQRAHAACMEMQSASEQEVHLYRTQFHQMQIGMLQEINQFQEAESGTLDHSRRQMAMVKLSENVARANNENATLRGELLMEEQRASEQKVLEHQLQLLESKYQHSEMASSDRMKEKDNETIRLREMLQHTQYVAHQEQQRVLLAEVEVEEARARRQHIEAFQQLDDQSSSRRVTGLHHECEELRRALHEREEEFKQMRHWITQMQTTKEVSLNYGNAGSAPLRTASSCRSSEPDWEMLSSVQPSSQVASSLRRECKSESAPPSRTQTQYYHLSSNSQSPLQPSPVQDAPMMSNQADLDGHGELHSSTRTMSSSGSLPAISNRRWSSARQDMTTAVSGTRPSQSVSDVNDVVPNSASTLETVPVPSGSKAPSVASSLVSESRVRHIISENLGDMQEQMKVQYEELYRMLQEQTMHQVWRRGADHLFVPPAANSCACTPAPTGTARNHALRQYPERHGAHYDEGNPTLLADDSQREIHAPDPTWLLQSSISEEWAKKSSEGKVKGLHMKLQWPKIRGLERQCPLHRRVSLGISREQRLRQSLRQLVRLLGLLVFCGVSQDVHQLLRSTRGPITTLRSERAASPRLIRMAAFRLDPLCQRVGLTTHHRRQLRQWLVPKRPALMMADSLMHHYLVKERAAILTIIHGGCTPYTPTTPTLNMEGLEVIFREAVLLNLHPAHH